MATNATFVIVGAGLAGAKGAEALRERGFDGRIVLLGDEPHAPYERPALSKEYLAGKSERDKLFVHPDEWYTEHEVELRTGVTVAAIDRASRRVTLADGWHIGYHRLLLATGASPRRLPVPGGDAEGVHYLRRVEDSERIRDTFAVASRLVVVGGGWIGLEVAAAARQAGVEVTLVEVAELPLLGVLGPEVAQVFAALHRDHGVDLRMGARVDSIETDGAGRAVGVRLAGEAGVIEADAVVVGVGAEPNISLAAKAGLAVDNGVVVDAGLATSDLSICAAGDIANAVHPLLGGRVRVEHWANALNQPAVAAATMLAQHAVYDRLPYFYTDQYDLGMEYTGFVAPAGYDQVVFRGDVDAREFIAFWCRDGRVLAGMNVNVWDVTDPIKALIASGRVVDPQALADRDRPLGELVTSS